VKPQDRSLLAAVTSAWRRVFSVFLRAGNALASVPFAAFAALSGIPPLLAFKTAPCLLNLTFEIRLPRNSQSTWADFSQLTPQRMAFC